MNSVKVLILAVIAMVIVAMLAMSPSFAQPDKGVADCVQLPAQAKEKAPEKDFDPKDCGPGPLPGPKKL